MVGPASAPNREVTRQDSHSNSQLALVRESCLANPHRSGNSGRVIRTRTLRSSEPLPKVGTLVGFRPIEPDDASRLVDTFDRLSLESRY
jgi:hypothetical protein